jgi:hypothetical protein
LYNNNYSKILDRSINKFLAHPNFYGCLKKMKTFVEVQIDTGDALRIPQGLNTLRPAAEMSGILHAQIVASLGRPQALLLI